MRETHMVDRAGTPIKEGAIVRKCWGAQGFGKILLDVYAYHRVEAKGEGPGGVHRWGVSGCANLIAGADLLVVESLPTGIAFGQEVDEHDTPIEAAMHDIPGYSEYAGRLNAAFADAYLAQADGSG